MDNWKQKLEDESIALTFLRKIYMREIEIIQLKQQFCTFELEKLEKQKKKGKKQ